MKQKLEFVTKILIYATFAVPLVVVPSSFIFPFIVPKVLIFRSLVIAMLGCYALLWAINRREYRIRGNLLNLAVLFFLFSFLISTFIGVDPYKSFWDNHERMLGLFTIFHYIAFYFVCSAVLKKWTDWQRALKIFASCGALVMVVAVLQIFQPNLLMNNGSNRVASTLGNPIYVGGYALFLIFAVVLLWLREENKIWRWILPVYLLLAIIGLLFSGTRGTILGFVVGAGAVILGYGLFLSGRPKLKKSLWGTLAGLLVLIIILFFNRQTEFVKNIPAVGRAINTTWTELQNTPRWVAWRIAIESWREKPIFGWGPNNYFYSFNKYYDPKLLEYGFGETWFDNAHNIIVNTLAVQGIVGILTYLGIFVLAIYSLIKNLIKKQLNIHLVVVGSGFLIAHLVQNITVFENPTSYLYFVFWLGMVSALAEPLVVSAEPRADKKLSNGLLGTVGVLVFCCIFIFNVQPARANMKTLQAIISMNRVGDDAVDLMKDALSFKSPHIDDVRNDISRTASQILRTPPGPMDQSMAREIVDIVSDELEKNLILHPMDIRVHIQLSQLFELRARIYNDLSYLQKTEMYWQDAIQYSPQRQQLFYSYAMFKLQTDRMDQAIDLIDQTIGFNPRIGEGYWRLAYLYKLKGDVAKCNEILVAAEADDNIIFTPNDITSIQKVRELQTPTVTVSQ